MGFRRLLEAREFYQVNPLYRSHPCSNASDLELLLIQVNCASTLVIAR